MKNLVSRENWIKSIKVALAAVLSIALAGELGLRYSATAGIITILSIQATKRETLQSARNRGLAFLCALLLAAVFYRIFGFTLVAFALYLLFFILLCLGAGWAEAITMDSVLISHFLAEKSMDLGLVCNEAGLFLIGAGTGILVNLHLTRKGKEFTRLAAAVDEQMKEILHQMSEWLRKKDKSAYDNACFRVLEERMRAAKLCAAANYNNSFRDRSTYEIDYIRMRERQSVVFQGIYENIKSITYLPVQTAQVADLFARIEAGYHKNNTVEGLLADLESLFAEMKREALPACREEFEARAILFYILKQVEKMLRLKREFIESHESFEKS